VYRQKLEEQRMLSDLIIDAMYKVGEFTQKLPTASGGDRKSENFKIYREEHFENEIKSNTTGNFDIKPKTEVIKELGFSKNQVSRFELMADNPELVEQAKQQAREKEECITQTKVIDFIKESKQQKEEYVKQEIERLDNDYEIYKELSKAIFAPITIKIDRERIEAWARCFKREEDIQMKLRDLTEAIQNLQDMKIFLTNYKLKGR
jgi:hypothetical protein